MRTQNLRAFTVVELLVVVAIIALLVGILLPAIGKARDGALLAQSQSNLRQIGTAWQTYAGEFGDRQMTLINDYMSQYGNNAAAPDIIMVANNYAAANGIPHPAIVIGYVTSAANPNVMAPYHFIFGGPGTTGGNIVAAMRAAQPMAFINTANNTHKRGAFRIFNARPLSIFLNGRFYDPVFYAPKDRGVLAAVERFFDRPEEMIAQSEVDGTWGVHYSSYVLSPAGMWNPDVLSPQHGAADPNAAPLYNNPWQQPSGFKSPAMSQVRYSNLKTLALEHHWLQNNKRAYCNRFHTTTLNYSGCEPYYYNASILSSPAAVFYDGHVATVGVRDAMDSNQRVIAQHGQQLAASNRGLWSKNTPLGGTYVAPVTGNPTGGYWMEAAAADGAVTSFHTLTSYGIKGRDIIPK